MGYARPNNPIITDDLLKWFIFVLLLQRDMTVLSRLEYLSRPDIVSSYPSASSGISSLTFCVTPLNLYTNLEIEINDFSHFQNANPKGVLRYVVLPDPSCCFEHQSINM